MLANQLFKLNLFNLDAIKKKITIEMIIIYATRRVGFNVIATGTMAAGIFESLNEVEDQLTATIIRHPEAKLTKLSFIATG